MKKGKFTTAFWMKAMLWLLSVMFVFTIVSKAAASFTVAQVKVDSPSSRKLLYTVEAEGRIGKNREISVLCQPDLLVKSIMVSEGEKVEKGKVLAKLDAGNVREQIESYRNKRQSLALGNEEYQKSQEQARRKQEREIARAKEDYARTEKKNEVAAAAARKKLAQAEERFKKALRDKKDFNKKEAARYKAEVKECQKSLQEALETKRSEETAARRALEDAQMMPPSDSRIAVNLISIKEIDANIKKLQKILRQRCRITAPEDGVITSVLVNVGQRTLDTAVFTMTDGSAGLKFTGQVALDDAKYVSANDSITLKGGKKTVADVKIQTIDIDEDSKCMNVTALLPLGAFSLGETVSMIVEQESENYSCTVPVTAVHQENSKYYVLLMETRDTVLGQQTEAVKIEVEVLEKNRQFAALEPSALNESSRIITDTDRYVAAGDRVRLRGSENVEED